MELSKLLATLVEQIPPWVKFGAELIAAFIVAYFVVFWFALVIWTFRDIQSRSNDVFAQILATLVVAAFSFPGWLIYYILRPGETLAQAYERSLEEEALLQEIETRPNCPGCRQRVEQDYQVCPACFSRLKNQCSHCRRLLNLKWNVCPFCGLDFTPGRLAVRRRRVPDLEPTPLLTDGEEERVGS